MGAEGGKLEHVGRKTVEIWGKVEKDKKIFNKSQEIRGSTMGRGRRIDNDSHTKRKIKQKQRVKEGGRTIKKSLNYRP